MTAVVAPVITLTAPMPKEWWPLVWDWMHQYPDMNFDDECMTTLDEFIAARPVGEMTCGVSLDGRPVGFLSYCPITRRLGSTRGICFDQSVHGHGVAYTAIRQAFDFIFAQGVEKIQAICFADNYPMIRLMLRLGGVQEGLLRKQFMRNGQPIDVVLMAFFN